MQRFRKAVCLLVASQAIVCSLAVAIEARGQIQHRRAAATVSPVTKVIALLGDLEAKLKAAASKEDVAYKKFSDWCRGGSKDKEWEIKTAKADIEDLQATIGKAQSDISVSASKIQDVAAAISTNDADLKAATTVREKEHNEFTAAEVELLDVVDTLDRAINLLERQMKGNSLLQAKLSAKVNTKDVDGLVKTLTAVVEAASLTLHDQRKLVGLVQNRASEEGDDEDFGAPAAEVYKSHGGGIIEVLEDLREKAQTQLAELRKQEVNAKHNYDLTKQSVQDQISADEKDLSEAKATGAIAAETKATAEGDLAVSEKDLADAEKSLETMTSSCMSAASDHEASVTAREEEMKVLAEAKAVLQESIGGAASSTYSFLQVKGRGSQRLSTDADLVNFEVVSAVRRLASKEHDTALAQLASRIQAVVQYGEEAGDDPFAKVKALIMDMLARLEEEAGSEATHKAYCDKEMAGTKEKIEELTTSVDRVRSKIDKKKATSSSLKSEVQELQAELADIAKSQLELDEARREENKAFVTKKADLELGLNGIRQALSVLREYYSKETSLLQTSQDGEQTPAVPEYHSKSTDASTGITGLLEVIESDFGKALAQAEMQEEAAATAYQKMSIQNKISKTTKEQDVKYKAKEAIGLDKQVNELSSDGESTQTELDAVLEYSKSIRAQCIVKPASYEERKARREAEVSGLREALTILEGEVAFFQQPLRSKALRGGL